MIRAAVVLGLLVGSLSAQASGIRSFVALPVEKDGGVVRVLGQQDHRLDLDTLSVAAAWGLTADDTLLFGMPFRTDAADRSQNGPFSVLYRRTLWRNDFRAGTTRFATLVGATVPTDGAGDPQAQVGAVFTHYRNRWQFDADALWRPARSITPAFGRYGLALDYRLAPTEYPDWGSVAEWHAILELSGRYTEGAGTTERLLLGGRYLERSWMVEFGADRDLSHDSWGTLVGFRWHL